MKRKSNKKRNKTKPINEVQQLQTENIKVVGERDAYSLLYHLFPLLEISRHISTASHYQELFTIYRNNGFKFPLNKKICRFMLNPFALIFGLAYFISNGLWLATLFIIVFVSTVMDNIYSLGMVLPNYSAIIISNVLCALTADFFITLRAEKVLRNTIEKNKKVKSKYEILLKVHQCFTRGMFIRLIFGIPFIIISMVFVLWATHFNSISLKEINAELMTVMQYINIKK